MHVKIKHRADICNLYFSWRILSYFHPAALKRKLFRSIHILLKENIENQYNNMKMLNGHMRNRNCIRCKINSYNV